MILGRQAELVGDDLGQGPHPLAMASGAPVMGVEAGGEHEHSLGRLAGRHVAVGCKIGGLSLETAHRPRPESQPGSRGQAVRERER